MKGSSQKQADQSHRFVENGMNNKMNKFGSNSNVMNSNRPKNTRGAITDVDGIQSATGTALHNGQLVNDDRRKQRMKDRMNDPRYRTVKNDKIN